MAVCDGHWQRGCEEWDNMVTMVGCPVGQQVNCIQTDSGPGSNKRHGQSAFQAAASRLWAMPTLDTGPAAAGCWQCAWDVVVINTTTAWAVLPRRPAPPFPQASPQIKTEWAIPDQDSAFFILETFQTTDLGPIKVLDCPV